MSIIRPIIQGVVPTSGTKPIIHGVVPAYTSAPTLPTRSIDFEAGSTQHLSMSDANFGAYDRAKWAISVWFKLESIGTNRPIMSQFGGAGNRAFRILFNTGNKLTAFISQDGSNNDSDFITTATYTDTTAYHHLLFHYDSANATAGNRIRLWVDGAEVVTFDLKTNPTAAVFDSTADMQVGAETVSLAGYFDGLIYQFGFFSGSLPIIGQVYNAGAPIDISGLTGLYSYLSVAGNSVVADGVLVADWTNNGTAISSVVIP